MIEVKITVHCPDIQAAAQIVAAALEKQAPQPAAPAPAAPTIPTAPAAPTIPTAAPPAYSLAQVAKAGADLLTAKPDAMLALQDLLAQFGVPAVSALQDDQLGAFATALRGLGADI